MGFGLVASDVSCLVGHRRFESEDNSCDMVAHLQTVNFMCGRAALCLRLVAILTCKSFVIHGYRGEKLIEPSSSWFHPKFPSGMCDRRICVVGLTVMMKWVG